MKRGKEGKLTSGDILQIVHILCFVRVFFCFVFTRDLSHLHLYCEYESFIYIIFHYGT